jgi:hypothetical protein
MISSRKPVLIFQNHALGSARRPPLRLRSFSFIRWRGLVRRHRQEKDRRRAHIELTDFAIKETMKFYGPIATEGSAILAAMSISELEVVKGFFDNALASQKRHTDPIHPRGTQNTRQHKI